MFKLTEEGKHQCERYIAELKAKRKEILDAKLDTADMDLPTVEDILCDVNDLGVEEDGEYSNCWGVTNNYDADCCLSLRLGIDLIEIKEEEKVENRSKLVIKTPAGYLVVKQKGASDDYPGVWVMLSKDGVEEGDFVACVEYDATNNVVQTVSYKPNNDYPQSITYYNNEEA